MCKLCAKIRECIKKRGLSFLVGFAFAIVVFVAVNAAMKPLSTSQYCGTACHEMDTAYTSWQGSVHAVNQRGLSVECVECHAPPKEKYFTHLAYKGYAGAKDTFKHFFGGEYDAEASREKVLEHFSNDKCLHCHDNLLAKPRNEMAEELHREVLEPSDESEQLKCTECHEDAAHDRSGAG